MQKMGLPKFFAAFRERSFRPKWWAILAAIAFAAVTIRLGNWQGDRAEYKLSQQAQLDDALAAAPVDLQAALAASSAGSQFRYHLLSTSGVFDSKALYFVDNRIHDGKAGYQLLQLFAAQLADGKRANLLVDRGWIAAPADRSLPKVDTPLGSVAISGRINLPSSRNPGTFDNADGARLNYINIDELRTRLQVDISPFLLEQNTGPGFTGVGKAPPSSNFEKNRAYQVQWYAFAGLAIVLLVVLSFRKRDNT